MTHTRCARSFCYNSPFALPILTVRILPILLKGLPQGALGQGQVPLSDYYAEVGLAAGGQERAGVGRASGGRRV